MRFREGMDDLLGNPIRLRLLRVLTRSPKQGFTGRELARMCGASPSQTVGALETLEASGVIFREIAGRSHVWYLSEQHILRPVLVELFRGEESLLKALNSELQRALSKLPVQRAFLFGSIASGEERPKSDVDLFVEVRSRADKELVENALSAASARFALKFGNPLSAVVLDESQVRNSANPGFIEQVLSEGLELRT